MLYRAITARATLYMVPKKDNVPTRQNEMMKQNLKQDDLARAVRIARESASARTGKDEKRAQTLSLEALSLVGLSSSSSNAESIESIVYNAPDCRQALDAVLEVQQQALTPQSAINCRTLEQLISRWSSWLSDYNNLLGQVYERLISSQILAVGSDSQEVADLLFAYAEYLAVRGENVEAQNCLSRVVRIRRRNTNREPFQTLSYAQALTRLGCLLRSTNSFEIAESNLKLASELLEPTKSRLKIHALEDLGAVYFALARYKEAESTYLKALQLDSEDRTSTMGCLIDLGSIYLTWQRLNDALALFDTVEVIDRFGDWQLPTFDKKRTWDDSVDTLRNPYLEIFDLMNDRYGDSNARRFCREMIVKKYSWAVPNEPALELIAKFAPIVEVGAGSGYWAKLLQMRGVDITAYDSHPTEGGLNGFFPKQSSWTEVAVATEQAAAFHPDRSLFICWPPQNQPMARAALDAYRGETLIYVGETIGGCTGDLEFFNSLERDWTLVHELALPRWYLVRDSVFVYTRKHLVKE